MKKSTIPLTDIIWFDYQSEKTLIENLMDFFKTLPEKLYTILEFDDISANGD